MDNWYRVSILGCSQGVIRSLGSSIIALSLCAGSVLVASASLAQQIDSDRDRQTAIQTAQAISQVTGVRINSTESGFYNESELGTSFTAPGTVLRAPERIYGLEAAIDIKPAEN
ncbi:MAG: hypothetical protein QNJ53_26390 [Pleurocapsa sp. MO_192.B19]|nr:hypothetical protein [Pleurocapsa sp. MO_192.B19]